MAGKATPKDKKEPDENGKREESFLANPVCTASAVELQLGENMEDEPLDDILCGRQAARKRERAVRWLTAFR